MNLKIFGMMWINTFTQNSKKFFEVFKAKILVKEGSSGTL